MKRASIAAELKILRSDAEEIYNSSDVQLQVISLESTITAPLSLNRTA